MPRDPEVRLTQATLRVLRFFFEDPLTEFSGADILNTTSLLSGSLYPILYRLEDAGWLTARWEQVDPSQEGRPRRRFYKLTDNGHAWTQAALAKRGKKEGALQWAF